MKSLRILLAFLRRDWQIHRSYAASWLTALGHLLFAMTAFFFVSRLIDPAHPATLAAYGGSYFPFVFLGLLVSRVLNVSLSSLAGNLREEQLQGSLEAILATPIRLPELVGGSMLWGFASVAVEAAIAVAAAVVLFKLNLGAANLAAAAVVTLLTIICLCSLGVFSACGILLLKEFDPTSWFLDGLMKLVSGVFVPVAVLPAWLKVFSGWLPMTYGLEGIRQAVLAGRTLAELKGPCLSLVLFSVFLWPVAFLAFFASLQRLKKDGALSFR